MNAVPYTYIKPSVIIELGALLMHDMASPADCKHDLSTTKCYLSQCGVDADFYVRWLHRHDVTCDCCVITNIALPLYAHVHMNGPEPEFLDDMFKREIGIH